MYGTQEFFYPEVIENKHCDWIYTVDTCFPRQPIYSLWHSHSFSARSCTFFCCLAFQPSCMSVWPLPAFLDCCLFVWSLIGLGVFLLLLTCLVLTSACFRPWVRLNFNSTWLVSEFWRQTWLYQAFTMQFVRMYVCWYSLKLCQIVQHHHSPSIPFCVNEATVFASFWNLQTYIHAHFTEVQR